MLRGVCLPRPRAAASSHAGCEHVRACLLTRSCAHHIEDARYHKELYKRDLLYHKELYERVLHIEDARCTCALSHMSGMQISMKEQLNNRKVAREVTDSIITEATASASAIDTLHSVWPSILRCARPSPFALFSPSRSSHLHRLAGLPRLGVCNLLKESHAWGMGQVIL